MTRVVLAYSGALADSIAIRWLAERDNAEVIAVTVDLGQGKEVLEEIRDRALATGALRAHVVDARELYLREAVLRGLKAGMLWHRDRSMAPALAVPLVAEKLVEVARIEQARSVAHADAAGADAPIDKVLRAIDPGLDVKAPASTWAMTPAQQLEYARRHRVLLPAALAGGVAVRAAACPDEPAFVEITFEHGVPIAANRVIMPTVDLVGSLDMLTNAHGVGGAAFFALHEAHGALQRTALTPDANAFCADAAEQYIRVLHSGSWFAPLRHALDAFVDTIQQRVSGTVRLKLFKGECGVVSVQLTAAQPHTIALARAR